MSKKERKINQNKCLGCNFKDLINCTYCDKCFKQKQKKRYEMSKTLGNTDVNGARKNVKDILVFGNGDTFKLLCKASSENEGWMKSTKVCETPVGCLVQVTTQQRNPDGSYSLAEALTFAPMVTFEMLNK